MFFKEKDLMKLLWILMSVFVFGCISKPKKNPLYGIIYDDAVSIKQLKNCLYWGGKGIGNKEFSKYCFQLYNDTQSKNFILLLSEFVKDTTVKYDKYVNRILDTVSIHLESKNNVFSNCDCYQNGHLNSAIFSFTRFESNFEKYGEILKAYKADTLNFKILKINNFKEIKCSLHTSVGLDRKNDKIKDNIQFDFVAEAMKKFQGTIEIKATIFNNNIDTVYFLSSSCYGEESSFCYDTAKFMLTPLINCNASYPIIIKIAPHGYHDFKAHFHSIRNENKIKLGFDFYSVDKSFDLTKVSLADIHHRNEKDQNIIWADEKKIKYQNYIPSQ